jgi:hypothetical protein
LSKGEGEEQRREEGGGKEGGEGRREGREKRIPVSDNLSFFNTLIQRNHVVVVERRSHLEQIGSSRKLLPRGSFRKRLGGWRSREI